MTQTQDSRQLPPVRLSGHCACCGAPTGKLFAMGHDARFRGQLQRALSTGDWDAEVLWFTSPTQSIGVTVADALALVASLVGKDWTERVTSGAARIGHRPAGAPPVVATADRPAVARPFDTQAMNDSRIDDLMRRLNAHPLTGQWGWLEFPPAAVMAFRESTGHDLSGRVAARVQRTRRFTVDWDAGEEPSSLVDFFVPSLNRVLERLDPALWHRDDAARL